MIRIILNDDEITLDQGDTVDALLQQLSMDHPERIAIAVNDSVVRRSDWSSYRLNDNDRVLMIAPVQGG
ncbi:MAG: sulfur carrier protein ThiS [Gammaproteobacteria bacterium]|nr:sulfur carrier protein ThiS [Gammaproteobacteria bacterium]